MDSSSSEDEDEYSQYFTCESALGNPLILQQIFTHLPTQFLLLSVSLVNSLWNREARSFIRDYRICRKRPSASLDSTCTFIAALDKLCCKTMTRARQIPWNGLKIAFFRPDHLRKDCNSSKPGPLKFKSDIKLKHLDISWFDNDAEVCQLHSPLQALFRQCAPDLLTLRLVNLRPESGNIITACLSELPKLEEIDLSTSYLTEEDEQSLKPIVGRLVEFSPNLKKIAAQTVENLAMFPEEAYGLLEKLEFRFRDKPDANLYRSVIRKRPAVQELVISGCDSASFMNLFDSSSDESDNSDGFPEEHDEVDVITKFHSILEPFLQICCSQSMRKMEIQWVPSLDGLSFPMLANLSQLRFTNQFGEVIRGMWTAITSVDYDQNMPNLEELQIVINTIHHGGSRTREVVQEIAHGTWPKIEPNTEDYPPRPPSCTSASLHLKLELEMKGINWPAIQSQFPNIPSLQIKRSNTSILGSDEPCPVSEVCRFWPGLEELAITGHNNELGRNHDADFCGIHEEEAERLRRQGKVYLKNVQIVPMKPSLLTMKNLRKVYITMGFRRRLDQQEGIRDHNSTLQFISRVTRLVTLRKMEDATVWDYASSSVKSDSDQDVDTDTDEDDDD